MFAIVTLKFLKHLASVIANFAVVALMTSVVGQTFAASEGHVAPEPTPQFSRVQGSINVAPNVVETGQTTSVTLSTSGFFDLTEVLVSQIGIRPVDGVSNLKIARATAQSMALSFQLSEDAMPGTRTLFIKDLSGNTVVALDLVLHRPSHFCMPPCQSPKVCRNNQCILPDDICQPRCNTGERCRNNRCVPIPPPRCDPPCTGIQICNDFGICEILR